MTPQEFQAALEVIRRDNPMGRQMDQALRARKEAIAGLLSDMSDDEIQTCVREASVRNLPRHMVHMVGVEVRARLKNPPKLPSAWDMLMGAQ